MSSPIVCIEVCRRTAATCCAGCSLGATSCVVSIAAPPLRAPDSEGSHRRCPPAHRAVLRRDGGQSRCRTAVVKSPYNAPCASHVTLKKSPVCSRLCANLEDHWHGPEALASVSRLGRPHRGPRTGAHGLLVNKGLSRGSDAPKMPLSESRRL